MMMQPTVISLFWLSWMQLNEKSINFILASFNPFFKSCLRVVSLHISLEVWSRFKLSSILILVGCNVIIVVGCNVMQLVVFLLQMTTCSSLWTITRTRCFMSCAEASEMWRTKKRMEATFLSIPIKSGNDSKYLCELVEK